MDMDRQVTLGDSIRDHRYNNFTFVRLLASLAVLLSHSFEVFSDHSDPVAKATRSLITAGHLGLCIFFFLSGLLVTQSLRKSADWKNFLWRRFIRLYPAACLVILSCAFILGPLLTTEDGKDYFSSPEFYQFLANCLLIRIHFTLPGVWAHAPGGSSLISPFWSIALELKLYIGLLAFWLLKIPGKRILALTGVTVAFLFNLAFFHETRAIFSKLFPLSFNPYPYTVLTPLFVAGVLCNLYQDRIRIKKVLLLEIIILAIISVYCKSTTVLTFIVIPAFVLCLATQGVSWIKKVTPPADLSYGIYLFGGPVGRVVTLYAHPASAWLNFFLSLLSVLPFAALSWYCVEKKMLSFKNRRSFHLG